MAALTRMSLGRLRGHHLPRPGGDNPAPLIGTLEVTEKTTGAPEDEASSSVPGGLASGPVDADAMEVARLLNGQFNSNNQSISNSAYYDLSLSSCLVRAPQYGDLVLYVEQAASETPTQPYRQRLYVITAGEGGTVLSEFWAPKADVELSGLCNTRGEPTEIAGDQFSLLDGCGVWLTKGQEGFVGSTEGKGCSSSLRGASYVSSEIKLTESLVQSWDQGFDANDTQVWGATAGPYNFDRVTEIVSPEAWAAEVVEAARKLSDVSPAPPADDEPEAQPSYDESPATSGTLSLLSLHTNHSVICSKLVTFISFFAMMALYCPIVVVM